MKSILRGNVDRATEQLLKVMLQSDEIEGATTRLKIDEEIQVAVGCSVTSTNRAEDTHVSGSMFASDAYDFRALLFEVDPV